MNIDSYKYVYKDIILVDYGTVGLDMDAMVGLLLPSQVQHS